MIVTIAIVAILAAILFQVVPSIIKRAETARCMNNMKQLHVVFSSYMQDKGHWPQEPENMDDSTAAGEDWWLNEMKDYGSTLAVWQCPTFKRLVTARSSNGVPKISYSPTAFDDKQSTPFRWATQPWFIERANMHGKGALVCFPDGSIRSMDEVLKSN